jgi:hypothetical protein
VQGQKPHPGSCYSPSTAGRGRGFLDGERRPDDYEVRYAGPSAASFACAAPAASVSGSESALGRQESQTGGWILSQRIQFNLPEQELSALKNKDDFVTQVVAKYGLEKSQAQRDVDALMKGRAPIFRCFGVRQPNSMITRTRNTQEQPAE